MYVPTLGNYLAVGGAKLVLTAVSPFQKLFDPPGITHEFCNQQAIKILHNDGFVHYAQFLAAYTKELTAGVYWADRGWRNVSHFFEPTTGKGLWQFATAMETFNSYYQESLANMYCKNYPKAVFLLGVVAHFVQDLCVPHHARAKIFCGHKEYESWVQEHYKQYGVETNGAYFENTTIATQLLNNAIMAADLFAWVNLEQGNLRYHDATTLLLPQAQRATAGLFLKFSTAAFQINQFSTFPPAIQNTSFLQHAAK